MKVKSESEVAQSCPTLSDPMDCSPAGSSVHGIFQARVQEWVAIAFSFYLDLASKPTSKRAQSHKTSPTPDLSHKQHSQVMHTSDQLTTN